MTLNKILSMTDEVQPNALPKEVKVQFLNEVESEVFDDLCEFFPAEEILKTNSEVRKYAWTKNTEGAENEDGKSDVSVSDGTSETTDESDSSGSSGGTTGAADAGFTGDDGTGTSSGEGSTGADASDSDAETGNNKTPEKKNPNAYVLDDPLNMGPKPYLVETGAVKLIPYTVDDDEAILLLDDRFAGVYMSYIKAKINYSLNELEDYANDASMFQAEIESWRTWMVKHHRKIHPKVRGLL